MGAHVETIDAVGRGLKARRIRFDDGSERITSGSAVKELSLEPGLSLSLMELDSALAEVEPGLARDRALRLLGYRERSKHELARRLADEGFSNEVVSVVIASLQESGLLDDERFAEQLLRTRVMSGYGSRRILRELLDHGIDRDTAEALIAGSDGSGDEAARLRALVQARPPTNRRERESVLRKLVGKGFALGAVIDALNDGAELPEESVDSDDA